MNREINIFVSYSPEDREWVVDGGMYDFIPWLKKQLKRKLVSFRIDHELTDNADIALLLISQDFATSDSILNHELPLIRERFEAENLKIIPLLISGLSESGIVNISWIFELEMILRDTKPLNDFVEYESSWSLIRVKLLDAIAALIQLINDEEAEAWYLTGEDYYFGTNGVEQDYLQALLLFSKAAEQGFALAQNYLGVMCKNGQGVHKDETAALEWFRKAALQGLDDAQFNLGLMYEYGQGVALDLEQAVEWYRVAAEQGHINAQNNLGWMYEYGQGVDVDIPKAIEWYRKAADQEDEYAKGALERLRQEGLL
ncbi:hypothetical protein FACS189416_3990 [Bacteroidia bacterium]|nr:hypothetical protein FACS189416_3990 [Bacteroidia bacterium]